MGRQIEEDEGIEDAEDWFPNILKNYESFVKSSYTMEVEETEYLKEYLKEDLQVIKKNGRAKGEWFN